MEQFQKEQEQIRTVQTNVDLLRLKVNPSINFEDLGDLTSSAPVLVSNYCRAYEKKYRESKAQFEQLQVMSKDRLRETYPSVIPDGILSNLLDELHEAGRNYVQLTNDASGKPQDRTNLQALIASLDWRIDDRTRGGMAAYEAQLHQMNARLLCHCLPVVNRNELDLNMTNDYWMFEEKHLADEWNRAKPFWEEKHKLAQMIESHKVLAAKIEAGKSDTAILKQTRVYIVDFAEQPKSPSGPNRFLGAVLLIIGLFPTVVGRLLIKSSDRSPE
jgi:hypothetical protein